MTSYFQYTPAPYAPSMPSPSGRLDVTWSGGVGSLDYGRIPSEPMGEYPINNCRMTGGRKKNRRRTSKKTRKSQKSQKRNKKSQKN